MKETGKLRSAAPGELAAEHLSDAGPLEVEQDPKHLEMNTTELLTTENEGPTKPNFDPWKDPGTNKDLKYLEDN